MNQLIKCHYNNDTKYNIISESFQKSSKDHNSKNDNCNDNYNDNYNDNEEFNFNSRRSRNDNDNKPSKLGIFLFYLFHLPFMFYVYPLYLFSKFLLNYKDNFLKYYKDFFNYLIKKKLIFCNCKKNN